MKNIIKIINNTDCVSVGTEYFRPEEYIQNILDQLRNDIFPLFNGTPLFTIARNTFCFIDHISAIKFGINKTRGEQTIRIKKLLSEFASFDQYSNEKYRRYASFIIQVYRHDLVHNIRPFPHTIEVIETNGSKTNKTSWFAIVQQVRNMPDPATFDNMANYFLNIRNRSGLCHLRYMGDQVVINNFCLFFDLVNYLKEYKKSLNGDKEEKQNFVINYQKIVDKCPKIQNFVLDKRIDKECHFK